MKKLITLLLLAILSLSITACAPADTPLVDTTERATEAPTDTEPPKEEYKTALSLKGAEKILSAEQESIKMENVAAYTLTMKVGATERSFRITAPLDYMHKEYPCVLYFPETRPAHEYDASIFVKRGYVCFGFSYMNVFDGDFEAEMAYLGELLEKCSFIKRDAVFVTGSSTGSIRAFLCAKVMGEQIKGVCTANSLCDLTAQYYVNETSKNVCTQICGGSPTEAAEAYERLSAKAFADKIPCPVLLISYANNPTFPISMCNDMKDALESAGTECTVFPVKEAGADFYNEEVKNALFDFFEGLQG